MSGALAGLLAVVCTYPLDIVRARLAASVSPEFRLVGGGARAVVEDLLSSGRGAAAKARSLFRGVGPSALGVIPYAGITFMAFGAARERLRPLLGPGMGDAVSGAAAGAAGQVATYPLDTVRRRLQVATFETGRPTAAALFMDIFRAEGVRGLYKGIQ